MTMILFRFSKSTKTTIGIFAFMIVVCCFCSCENPNCSDVTGGKLSDACIPVNQLTEEEIMDNVKTLGKIFFQMVENSNSYNALWKNIPLGHRAFAMMKDDLPLRVKGELTPYTRIVLLDKMMGCMPERDCTRFFKEVQLYQKDLFALISDEDLAEDMDIDGYDGDPKHFVRCYTLDIHERKLKKTLDYLDPKLSMEDWCRMYGFSLKFDPIERSEACERCIYDVESECDSVLRNEPKGMGFCFSYWSTKKAVLAKHGIQWRSPSAMNPRVMFD